MIKEQVYFLELLNDHLHKKESELKEDIDWGTIEKYAKRHVLAPIIYAQTKRNELKEQYFFQLYYYAQLIKELNDLHNAIYPIDYFVFKGIRVAELYPVPALRTMGDIDIRVHARDQEIVHQKIVELGYTNTIKKNEQVWHYQKKYFEIELHSQMLFANNFQSKKLEDFCQSCWQYYKNYKIDWNFHLLFILIHLRKHFIRDGVGFRQFMDVAVICQNKEIDWDWIIKKSKDLDIYDFIKMVLTFVHKWFDIEIPIELPAITEEFYDYTTNWVFANGVFGFDNKANDTNRSAVELRKLGIFKWLVKTVFLPYSNLIKYPEYQFLVGRKYLILLAWAKRIFEKIVNLAYYKKRYASIKNNNSEKNDFYNLWGI